MNSAGFRQLSSLIALFAGLMAAATTQADEDDWSFATGLYLWGANIDIEAANGTNSEIRFTDIVDDMELAGMAALAARRGKWEFGADLIYLDIDDNVEQSILPGIELNDLGLQAWVITPMVGYQIQQSERSEVYLIGGARYLWIELDQKFDFGPPLPADTSKENESGSSWDGIVGFRGQWSFSDEWYASYHFDVGTGDSDSTWQALGTVNYRFERLDVAAGYRYLDWSDTEADALKDLNLSGFIAGVKFFF